MPPVDEDDDSCCEEDPPSEETGKQGGCACQDKTKTRARTYWVVPAGGSGGWTDVAERDGLFLASGERLYEARQHRFKRKLSKKPRTERDEAGKPSAACGGNDYQARVLLVDGQDLVMRELDSGVESPVYSGPRTFDELERCVHELQWRSEPLGALGRYLFLHVRRVETVFTARISHEFLIFDLEKKEHVKTLLLPEGPGGWRGVVDPPERRAALVKSMKTLWQERGYQEEFKPQEIFLSHLWPVFPRVRSATTLQVAFRHPVECAPCPAAEVRTLVDDLPPELRTWKKRHPAIAPVEQKLACNWRIAGMTVVTAPPDKVKKMQALFTSFRGPGPAPPIPSRTPASRPR
ncbi:MAG: hypothetical protein RBU30_08345 [Polyangia bacterium]|jgi:hypothetical protein|nr:hypothetical protein [Polyangia bacterium]